MDSNQIMADQKQLIQQTQNDIIGTPKIIILSFGFIQIVFLLLSIKSRLISVVIWFFIFLIFSIINIVLTNLYSGPQLVGISYSLFGDTFINFDIKSEPYLPEETDVNYFWGSMFFSLIYWVIETILLSIDHRSKGFFIGVLFIITQILHILVFLKGNALATKSSVEAVKSVLFGENEAFKELPEQATLDNPNPI